MAFDVERYLVKCSGQFKYGVSNLVIFTQILGRLRWDRNSLCGSYPGSADVSVLVRASRTKPSSAPLVHQIGCVVQATLIHKARPIDITISIYTPLRRSGRLAIASFEKHAKSLHRH